MRLNNIVDRKLLRNIDVALIVTMVLLVLIGIVAIASATQVTHGGSLRSVQVQSAAFILGLISILLILLIDYNNFGDNHKAIYIINIALLVLVLFVGTKVKGAKSWIDFGPINFQPAEAVKIGFILCFAKFLEKRKNKLDRIVDVLPALLYIAPLLLLIQLQPDTGTVLVYVFFSAFMLFAAGLNYKYIVGSIGAFIASAPILWFFVLKEHQKNRFLAFLNPAADPRGKGYQVMQSKTAIGSGQIVGKGLFDGTMNNLGYIPERHNDFIFSVIGEELGLIGALVVILLFMLLLLRCIHIAKVAKDDYGMLICVGVMAMYLFHIFENIGMTIGVMPVTGIPLPFISSGGSSLLFNMMAVGLVINVGMRRQIIRF
ncbi:MAG: rod shape-determining protein RodA [Bacillota bacterium]